MITNSKQVWAVGHTVKVGFLTLRVRALLDNNNYQLTSLDNTKLYSFIPYLGLLRVS